MEKLYFQVSILKHYKYFLNAISLRYQCDGNYASEKKFWSRGKSCIDSHFSMTNII